MVLQTLKLVSAIAARSIDGYVRADLTTGIVNGVNFWNSFMVHSRGTLVPEMEPFDRAIRWFNPKVHCDFR